MSQVDSDEEEELSFTDLRNLLYAHLFNYHHSPVTPKLISFIEILDSRPLYLLAWLICTLE